jgi:diketogulonate reductase-like aldo/keto reductase
MPFSTIKLNDGRSIPGIAYGSWTLGNGREVIDQVEQGLDVGFDHLDTAQVCLSFTHFSVQRDGASVDAASQP